MRRSKWRGVVALAAASFMLASCGRGEGDTLLKAQDRFATTHHGWIDLQIAANTPGHDTTGVRLTGTYELPTRHAPAALDLKFIRVRGDANDGELEIHANGDSIQTGTPGNLRDVTTPTTADLRPAKIGTRLLNLEFADWVTDARSQKRASGDTITVGHVNARAFLESIVPLVAHISGDEDLPRPSDGVVRSAARKVRASGMAVITRADGSLKRISAVVRFRPAAVDAVRAVLGGYAGSEVIVGLRSRHGDAPTVGTTTTIRSARRATRGDASRGTLSGFGSRARSG